MRSRWYGYPVFPLPHLMKEIKKLLVANRSEIATTLYAESEGKVAQVLVYPESQVAPGDLMIRLE